MRDVQLFLSLEHLEATVGLLIGLISILFCLREHGDPRRGREMGEQPVSEAVRTHTILIEFHILYGCSLRHLKTMTIVTSKIIHHRSPKQV